MVLRESAQDSTIKFTLRRKPTLYAKRIVQGGIDFAKNDLYTPQRAYVYLLVNLNKSERSERFFSSDYVATQTH